MKSFVFLTAIIVLTFGAMADPVIANESARSLSPGKADPGGVDKPGSKGNGAENGTRTNGPAGVAG